MEKVVLPKYSIRISCNAYKECVYIYTIKIKLFWTIRVWGNGWKMNFFWNGQTSAGPIATWNR